jgi:hypothetical protein
MQRLACNARRHHVRSCTSGEGYGVIHPARACPGIRLHAPRAGLRASLAPGGPPVFRHAGSEAKGAAWPALPVCLSGLLPSLPTLEGERVLRYTSRA